MSDFIKPRTKVSGFGSLDGTTGWNDPRASLHRVQMCFIWNSQHMGGVIVPLRSLASTDNVVDDIPYFPARPKFSDKRRSKLYKTWAGRLANVSNSWDSTWIECKGPAKACEPNPRPFYPAIQNRYFCPWFDEIRHRLWAALALKIAEVRIWPMPYLVEA